MSPQSLGREIVREVPLLSVDERIGPAVARIIAAKVPALPVVDGSAKLVGIFGEREFIGAIFPGYLGELSYAGFVPGSVAEALEKRAACSNESVSNYMNTEHIDVGTDFSDTQLAETFLHHRVLIIPVVDERRVVGVVTRWEFFVAVADRLATVAPDEP